MTDLMGQSSSFLYHFWPPRGERRRDAAFVSTDEAVVTPLVLSAHRDAPARHGLSLSRRHHPPFRAGRHHNRRRSSAPDGFELTLDVPLRRPPANDLIGVRSGVQRSVVVALESLPQSGVAPPYDYQGKHNDEHDGQRPL